MIRTFSTWAASFREKRQLPTIFHVTHQKAGSQWIARILRQCAVDRVIEAEIDETQITRRRIQTGSVYLTAYVTKEELKPRRLPANSRVFIVLRDLRDALVSGYFSLKSSHPEIDPRITEYRKNLQTKSMESGLIYLMDSWLPLLDEVQRSWIGTKYPVVHYEELLVRDVEILTSLLTNYCELPISKDALEEIILSNRFEAITNGRCRGTEDLTAHERKGIAGDWTSYFSEKTKKYFKDRFGDMLIAWGYERGMDW